MSDMLEARFLQALRESRSAYDDPPDWRAALALYDELSGREQRKLDRLLVRMIDEDYRNPCSSRENLPFDDVMVNLPSGMTPDDLLCIEAAVLVAAERRVGEAFFAFNRLMRAPRWHAMFPRLYWLNYSGFEAQRQLGLTRAGRGLGALAGLALGQAVAPGAADDGGLTQAVHRAISDGERVPPEVSPAAGAYQRMVSALLGGSSKAVALEAAGSLVSGAVERAAVHFLHTDSFEACVTAAAEVGQDGAQAAGGLAGAYYGPLAAPRRWTSQLGDRAQLEALAERLYEQYSSTH